MKALLIYQMFSLKSTLFLLYFHFFTNFAFVQYFLFQNEQSNTNLPFLEAVVNNILEIYEFYFFSVN